MRKHRILSSISLFACLISPAARAQDNGGLEEIIVTAQKRSEIAKDVPITITALTGQRLETLGIRSLDEASRYIPGLNIQEQSPNNPGFVIRGITSDDGSSQIAPRVSVYYNGVDVSRARGSYFDLFDIESIEVVKGPQATLFGTASLIGAVSVRSAKPTAKPQMQFTAGYGNFDAISTSGFLNSGGDIIRGRIAWSYRERGGVVENVAGTANSQTPAGPKIDDLNGKNALGVRASLQFLPRDDWQADLVVTFDRQNPPGTAFKSSQLPPTGGNTSPFTFAELGGAPANLSQNYLGGAQPGLNRKVWDVNLTVQHKIDDAWALTSITGYRSFDSNEVFDADGSAAVFLEFAEDSRGEQASQELRLSYKGDRLRAFAGANYFYETGTQRVPFVTNLSIFGSCAGALGLFGGAFNPAGCVAANGRPVAAAAPFVPFVSEFQNDASIDTFSAFADATLILGPVEATAGVRYVSETRESGYLSRLILNPAPTARPPIPATDTGGVRVQAKGTNDAVLPRFNLLWRATDTANFYATVSKGRRSPVTQVSGGRLVAGVLTPITTNIPDEIVWNYEGGVKSAWFDNRLTLDLSGYYQTYRNFQVTRVINGVAVTENAGKASNWGLEAAVQARPLPWLTIFGNAGYVNAKINQDAANGVFAGQRFRLQPDWQSSLGLTARYNIGENFAASLTPSWTYRGQHFFELPNTAGIEQAAYSLINVRGSVETADGKYGLTAYVNNLTDKEYVIDAGNTGGSFRVPTFIRGEPRLFGFELRARY
jgi:iron complex outermembrane recepter protein